MNSKILVMDVDSVDRSPMLAWWERHTDEIVYFDELDDPYDYISKNVHRGVMVITENESIVERIEALDVEDGFIIPGGGLCIGDAMIFNEPLQCIRNDGMIWWCDEDSDRHRRYIARDFVRSYPYKDEYEVTKALAPKSIFSVPWRPWHDSDDLFVKSYTT